MLVILVVLVCAMFCTNGTFSVLDDEVTILDSATQTPTQTLDAAIHGGQHEHPPLSDLLVHEWLEVSPNSTWALRAPAIILYGIGIGVLALAGWELGGRAVAIASAAIGAISPLGFHLGRLAGWYAWSFFCISLLTWAYILLRQSPTRERWICFIVVAIVLLYSNYAGWGIVGILLLDYCFAENDVRRRVRNALLVLAALAIAYVPLGSAFIGLLAARAGRVSAISAGARVVFNLYAMFVSESVAPWMPWLAVPAAIMIAVAVVSMYLRGGAARRLLVGSLMLTLSLVLLNEGDTKRLIIVLPWMTLACALAMVPGSPVKTRVAFALSVVVAIGWAGIFSGRYYAAPHWREPWPEIARSAAGVIRAGGLVIAVHPSFFYYASRELRPSPRYTKTWPDDCSMLCAANLWTSTTEPRRTTVVVESASGQEYWRGALWNVRQDLDSRCRLESESHYGRDPGYQWKQRLFPHSGQEEWRITWREYRCDTAAVGP